MILRDFNIVQNAADMKSPVLADAEAWVEIKSGWGGLGEEEVSIHTIMFTTSACQPQGMHVRTFALHIKQREGGIGGRAQRLPPKQNESTSSHM